MFQQCKKKQNIEPDVFHNKLEIEFEKQTAGMQIECVHYLSKLLRYITNKTKLFIRANIYTVIGNVAAR